MHYISKTIKWLITILIIDLTIFLLWSSYVIKRVDSLQKSPDLQVVVILMGDFTNNYKELGPETVKRLNHALSLKDEVSIDNYLCVGGSRPTENIVGAELMKEYLGKGGIPIEQIHTDGHSFDTKGNWTDAVRLIERNQWKTVGVISSSFHLYRFNEFIAEPPGDLQVYLMPFPYHQSSPKTSLANLWITAHYEWLTYTLYAMPEPLYNTIISYLRPQQPVQHSV
jgi:uncharacterized SAM-binding protein YcdF (DUF218 family)